MPAEVADIDGGAVKNPVVDRSESRYNGKDGISAKQLRCDEEERGWTRGERAREPKCHRKS